MNNFQRICEVIEIEMPMDRSYDGINLQPYISVENKSHPHEYLFWQRGFSKAIRNNQWKLCINEKALDTVLFDMVKDPFEKTDLYQQHKDIAENLSKIHCQWSSGLPSPLWPSMIYYRYEDESISYYFDQ